MMLIVLIQAKLLKFIILIQTKPVMFITLIHASLLKLFALIQTNQLIFITLGPEKPLGLVFSMQSLPFITQPRVSIPPPVFITSLLLITTLLFFVPLLFLAPLLFITPPLFIAQQPQSITLGQVRFLWYVALIQARVP